MVKGDYSRNAELLERAREGDKTAFDLAVTENLGLVHSIAHRFGGRGVELEDLVQIGTVGLIKAVRSFDASYGTVFSTYAVPVIMGEIKRFLRDDSLIKVSRGTKKLAYEIMHAREDFVASRGREPLTSELSQICGVTAEELIYALDSTAPVGSLSEPVGGEDSLATQEDFIGEDRIDEIITSMSIREAIGKLPEQSRELILLRYFKGLSQVQTAKILGISQVKVSREERKICEDLRKVL